MRVEMDAIAPLETEAEKIEREIKKSEKAFDVLTKKHEEQVSPLYIRRAEINVIRKNSASARSRLRETCEDRELVHEYEAVREELNAAEHERATITERRRYEVRAESHRDALANWQTKLEPVDRVVADLQDRMSGIEEMLLEP